MITIEQWEAARRRFRELQSAEQPTEQSAEQPTEQPTEYQAVDQEQLDEKQNAPEEPIRRSPRYYVPRLTGSPLILRLREERRKRDWSQRWVGELIGVTGSAISQYEGGYSVPNLATLVAWARIFGLELALVPSAEEEDVAYSHLPCGCPVITGHLGDCPDVEAA